MEPYLNLVEGLEEVKPSKGSVEVILAPTPFYMLLLGAFLWKFRGGTEVRTARTEFGKVAIIICGDLYNKRIAKWVRRKRPDFLFVPMEYSPDYGELNEEDVEAMAERVGLLGARAFIANSHPPGGAWVFDSDGKLLASSMGDEILVVEV